MTRLTPEREQEIRNELTRYRENIEHCCQDDIPVYATDHIDELLAEIDYLRDSFLDMGVVRQNTYKDLLETEKECDQLKAENKRLNTFFDRLSTFNHGSFLPYYDYKSELLKLNDENIKLRERIAKLRKSLLHYSASRHYVDSTNIDAGQTATLALAHDDELSQATGSENVLQKHGNSNTEKE